MWAIGFVVVFAGKVISHFSFRHRVMSASIPVRDTEVLELFEQELNRLEYYHPVSLVISSAVDVPLSMGAQKKTRVTVLPNREFTKQELLDVSIIRYLLSTNSFKKYMPVTIATNVSESSVAAIM